MNTTEEKIKEMVVEAVGVGMKPLAESINTRFDVVDARFDTVDKKFNEVDARFDVMDKKFEDIDVRFDRVDGKFDEVDKRFDIVDRKFDFVKLRFDSIDSQFQGISDDIRLMGQKIYDKIDENTDEVRRDFGALVEDVRDVIKAGSEQFNMGYERNGEAHDRFDSTLTRHDTRITSLERR